MLIQAERGTGHLSARLRAAVLLVLAVVALVIAPTVDPPAGFALGDAGSHDHPGAPPARRVLASAAGDVEAFGAEVDDPTALVADSSGNIWFANRASIGRLAPDGEITRFEAVGISEPSDIAVGPDGNIWFTNGYPEPSIGRITPTGDVSLFTDSNLAPTSIAAGPDGNLWFTNSSSFVCNPTCHATTMGAGKITPAGVITHFPAPSVNTFPTGMTAGADGRMWYSRSQTTPGASNAIVAITVGGTSTTYSVSADNRPRRALVQGPDGNIWFSTAAGHARVTPAGAFTFTTDPLVADAREMILGPGGGVWFSREGVVGSLAIDGAVATLDAPGASLGLTALDGDLWYTDAAADVLVRLATDGSRATFGAVPIDRPSGLAVADDGSVWFTNIDADTVGRLSTTHEITAYDGPGIARPAGMALGADGNLWFANFGNNSIGRVTPEGSVSFFTGAGIDDPYSIASGPDGALWFTNTGNNSIGRIGLDGAVSNFTGSGISFRSGSITRSTPDQITSGPDGALWFTNTGNDSIGRISVDGEVTNFADAGISDIWGIAAGPDGALWFTGTGDHSVGRISVDGQVDIHPLGEAVRPGAITTGADGALWLTTGNGADPAPAGREPLVRLTTDGTISWFEHPSIAHPNQVAAGPDGMLWFPNAESRTIGRLDTGAAQWGVPSAPSVTTTEAGDGEVTVAWDPPASEGTSPVTGYVVVASDGHTCGWVSGPLSCTVRGLTNLEPVSFVVRAVNAVGPGSPSEPSATVRPHSGALFRPIAPFRLIDSRDWGSNVGPYDTPWGPAETRTVDVGGQGGVPETADAVVLNVTAIGGSAASHLRVWPVGQQRPLVSSLNWDAGATVPNSITVGLGDGGALAMFNNSGTVDVVVDVAGYYDLTDGDGYTPVTPARVSDSRPPGLGAHSTPWGPGVDRVVPIAGLGGVPADATAVSLNVTVTSTTAPSHLSVWPSGTARPVVSNLNWVAGQTVANTVTVPLGADGAIEVFNNKGQAHVVVDVTGYYTADAGVGFHRINPVRAVDSRPPGLGTPGAPWSARSEREVRLAGPSSAGGIPSGAEAVVANVTVTNTSSASHLAAWPAGGLRPRSSVVNWSAGQTVANGSVLGIGADGEVTVFNNEGNADVIIDIAGWFGG